MDKLHTVKKSREFSTIIHSGNFVKNNSYVMNYLKEKGKSKLSELTFKEAYDLLKKDDKEKEEVF